MPPTNELIEKYLDESLTDDEVRELHDWLSEDVANVREFTRALAREEQLRATVKTAIPDHATTSVASPPARIASDAAPHRTHWTRTAVGVVAALCLVLLVWVSIPAPEAAAALTLVRSRGDVSLRDDNGRIVRVEAGDEFTSGAFLVDGFGSSAELADAAGSSYSLSEGSELELVRGRGTTFVLHRGALIAEVPDDVGRPFTVRTPTAETTASGIVFAMNSADTETLLQVKRGSARVRRLADEQVVTVALNEQVRAGRETDEPMQVEAVPPVPTNWTAAETKGKDTTWAGTWTDDGTLKAGPNVVHLSARNVDVTHYHAGGRNIVSGLVKLEKDSVIRVRYRTSKRINVGLFVSTRSEAWDFTGNFQAYLVETENPPDADGWRTATVPVTSLTPVANAKRTFQPGNIAATIFATTYSDDVGLEIAELSVLERKPDGKKD